MLAVSGGDGAWSSASAGDGAATGVDMEQAVQPPFVVLSAAAVPGADESASSSAHSRMMSEASAARLSTDARSRAVASALCR